MTIRRLSALVINQIAAGEVIERPASVVKELVENSLDAGATQVVVVLEEGGTSRIEVRDDGRGIASEELLLALTQHATSKITEASELEAVATLGFRGEALASIASVSRLRIESRVGGAEAGGAVEAHGAEVGPVTPVGCPPGTCISVRQLFYNTPARRKFLRTPGTEAGHCVDAVQRLAMACPGVAFRVEHGGRQTLDLPRRSTRFERCIDLLGRDLEEGLIAFESDPSSHGARPAGEGRGEAGPGGLEVWGLAGVPSLAKATGKHQHFFCNGRAIRDRRLVHAAKEAYRGLMPHDKYPLCVVMLEMDPREVDVNVHPAKSEVRFRNPGRVHAAVLNELRRALLGRDLTPSAGLLQGRWGAMSGEASGGQLLGGDAQGLTLDAARRWGDEEASPSADAFVDYFRRMDPLQRGLAIQRVRDELTDQEREPGEHAGDGGRFEANASGASGDGIGGGVRHHEVLQVHDSYVVTQDEHGLVIIDQHALHERVMFERLSARILGQGKAMESQRLLMPAVVEVEAKRQGLLQSLEPLLAVLGLEVDAMGPRQVAVHAFPTLLFDRGVDPAAFVGELLDLAEKGELDEARAAGRDGVALGAAQIEPALHVVLDMMSCKAAVKAGDALSDAELTELLAERERIERSTSCPHGRPTSLRLTLKDLEKRFGRT